MKTPSIKVEVNGATYSLQELADKHGLSYSCIYGRYKQKQRGADLCAPQREIKQREIKYILSESHHFTVGTFATFGSRNTAAIALNCSAEKLQKDIDDGVYGKGTSLSEIITTAWKPARRVA